MSILSPTGAKLLKSLNIKSISFFLITLLSFGIVSIFLQTHIYAKEVLTDSKEDASRHQYNLNHQDPFLLTKEFESNLFRPNYLHIYGEDFDYSFFSYATTIKEVVNESKLEFDFTFDKDDLFSPNLNEKVIGDMWIKYTKIDNKFEEVKTDIPYKTICTTDINSPVGQQNILIAGKLGEYKETYKITFEDGIKTNREKIGSEISKLQIDQIITKGTKLVQTKECIIWDKVIDNYTSDSAERYWLKSVMRCESGCNERNISPSGVYKGLFQYDTSTFNNGGGGDIFNGSQQIEQTLRRYRAGQLTKWPACNAKVQQTLVCNGFKY